MLFPFLLLSILSFAWGVVLLFPVPLLPLLLLLLPLLLRRWAAAVACFLLLLSSSSLSSLLSPSPSFCDRCFKQGIFLAFLPKVV